MLHVSVVALILFASAALSFSPSPNLYTRTHLQADSNEDCDFTTDDCEAELSIKALDDVSSLGPAEVVRAVVRSMQYNDTPEPNAGLRRVFDVFTWECRKAVAHRSDEPDTVERFVKFGSLSPKLQYFAGASDVEFGEATEYQARPPTRGAMYHQPVRVHGSAALAVAHASGLERTGVAAPPVRDFIVCLRQERRPPRAGEWLVNEVLDCASFAGDVHLES